LVVKRARACSFFCGKIIRMKKGFTLIELLVVVSIIEVLSSVVMSSLSEARASARNAKRLTDLRNIQNALELYYLDHNSYPSTSAGAYLDPGCANGNGVEEWIPGLVSGGYMSVLPVDPNPVNQATGATGASCYMYQSQNSDTYILSAWGTVERGPIEEDHARYSRAGFREANFTYQTYLCNHQNIQGYYPYSYTITNVDCNW